MDFFSKIAILTENPMNFDVTCSVILSTVCCTIIWWYKGRKLNGLVFRASLITKDNIAEYLQSQRRKKAILQVPEPFVIRLEDFFEVEDNSWSCVLPRILTEFLLNQKNQMTSEFRPEIPKDTISKIYKLILLEK